MSYIAIVGRDVQGEPMDQEAWESFCSDLVQCFDHDATITGRAWSTEWGGEETFAVIGQPVVQPEAIVNLGWVYGQEAVALGWVDTFDSTRTWKVGELR